MYQIYKKLDIASAHKLDGHPKCGKLHGHNYILEMWIDSEDLQDPYNFVLDFHAFSSLAKYYDHSGTIIAESSELFAERIVEGLRANLPKIWYGTIKVRVWESDHTYAQFTQKYNQE